jgi:hypothetical protein
MYKSEHNGGGATILLVNRGRGYPDNGKSMTIRLAPPANAFDLGVDFFVFRTDLGVSGHGGPRICHAIDAATSTATRAIACRAGRG